MVITQITTNEIYNFTEYSTSSDFLLSVGACSVIGILLLQHLACQSISTEAYGFSANASACWRKCNKTKPVMLYRYCNHCQHVSENVRKEN